MHYIKYIIYAYMCNFIFFSGMTTWYLIVNAGTTNSPSHRIPCPSIVLCLGWSPTRFPH